MHKGIQTVIFLSLELKLDFYKGFPSVHRELILRVCTYCLSNAWCRRGALENVLSIRSLDQLKLVIGSRLAGVEIDN